jgi:hypothetical protein
VWVEAFKPGDTVKIAIGRDNDRDAAPERSRSVHGVANPQGRMGSYEVQRQPEIILTEVVQQAQRGNVASLLPDTRSIESPPAENVRVLLDQFHARFACQHALCRKPD